MQVALVGWLLTRQRWCSYAAHEVGYASGHVDVLGVSCLPGLPLTPDHEVAWQDQEEARRELLSPRSVRQKAYRGDPHRRRRVMGDNHVETYSDIDVPPIERPCPAPRIQVIEVKTTVADLQADLRERKTHTYEPWCTHLVIAGPTAVLERAEERVPPTWGLLHVQRGSIHYVRQPRRLRRGSPRMVIEALHRLTVATAWRAQRLSERDLEG
jgi:hypothetical protein